MPRGMNRKGRSKAKFVMLRHDIMDSPAWHSLSPLAVCVWLAICRRYNSLNNGDIPLSCREIAVRHGVSKDSAAKAFQELIVAGFIRIGQDSAFNVKTKKARRWILTHESYANRGPTSDWREFQK